MCRHLALILLLGISAGRAQTADPNAASTAADPAAGAPAAAPQAPSPSNPVVPTPTVPCSAVCGYRDEGGNLWQSAIVLPIAGFTQMSEIGDFQIEEKLRERIRTIPQALDREFEKKNVYIKDGEINIVVRGQKPPNRGRVSSGQIATRRNDILYGSFRVMADFPTAPGVVSSLYAYQSDNAEIDLEVLSRRPTEVSTTIHPQVFDRRTGAVAAVSKIVADVSSITTSDGFYEYRFDWVPGRVDYYVQGRSISTLTTNVPTVPMRIQMASFSNGNPGFSGGPPEVDTFYKIARIALFFNSTRPPPADPRCADLAVRDTLVCSVQEVQGRDVAITIAPPSAAVPSRSALGGILAVVTLYLSIYLL